MIYFFQAAKLGDGLFCSESNWNANECKGPSEENNSDIEALRDTLGKTFFICECLYKNEPLDKRTTKV